MERECNKCIHHTSGMCDSWECKMQTVEDAKKEAVKEYVEAVVAKLEELEESAKDMWYGDDYFCGKAHAYNNAILIVRGKE